MIGYRVAMMIVALLASGACSKAQTPESQVRAALARAETAAESKELSALRELISDRYRDSQGQDKRALEALLRVYFLRNQSVHVFTHVQTIRFPEPDRAQVVVLAALAGQAVTSAAELERLRADLYRFEIVLVRETDRWRVLSAEWRPAQAIEFL